MMMRSRYRKWACVSKVKWWNNWLVLHGTMLTISRCSPPPFSSSQYFSSLSTLFICRVVFFIFTLFCCYLYLHEYSFFERMFQNNYIFFPFLISPCISLCPFCLSAYPFNDNNHVNLIIIKMLLFSIIVLMFSILFFFPF